MKPEDMARYFTDLGPDMDLLRLAGYSKLELIKELVENRGANVNARNDRGSTPLHEAAEGEFGDKSAEIIRYLISQGADIDAVDSKGQTPLDVAASSFNSSLCGIELLKYNAQTNTNKTTIFEEIIRFNRYMSIELTTQIHNINNLKKVCSNLKVEDRDEILKKLDKHETRFMKSVPAYCIKVLEKRTLEEKEKILKQLKDLENKSPYLELGIRFLEIKGNSFSINDYRHDDTYNGFPIKEYFRSEDPYEDLQTFVSVSALPLVVYAIEELRLDVNHFKKPTLLKLALSQDTEGGKEVASYLLKKGADPDIKDADGFNAFDKAIMLGQNENIKLLIPYLPDLNIITIEKFKDNEKGLLLEKLMDVVYFNFGEIDISTQIRYMFSIGIFYDSLKGNDKHIKELNDRLDILIDWFLYTVKNHIKSDSKKVIEKRQDIPLLEFLQEVLEDNSEIIDLKNTLKKDIISMFSDLFKNISRKLDDNLVWRMQEYCPDDDLLQVALIQEEVKANGEEKDVQEV